MKCEMGFEMGLKMIPIRELCCRKMAISPKGGIGATASCIGWVTILRDD